MKFYTRVSVACLLLAVPLVALAQNDTLSHRYFTIKEVTIAGNKKTKTSIIQREIPFRKGDTVAAASVKELLLKTRENIYNTKLFLSVDLMPQVLQDSSLYVLIIVKERWYTYPLPYMELADRSFNVWWHTYHADLRRLSYGIYFMQENLSGRNDELDVKATLGFNKQINVEYTTPYINKGMSKRLRLGGGLLSSNEIPYATTDSNKLQYFQSTSPVRKEWFLSLGYLTRNYIKKREWLTLSLSSMQLSDSIQFYNPHFIAPGKSHIIYPELTYKLKYDNVDNIIYPLKGKSLMLTVSKRGLGWDKGVDRLMAEANTKIYSSLGRKWYSILSISGQIKLPFDQPYYNTRALGYGENYLRGYEYYVVDGVAFFLAKADLKKRLVHFELPTFLKSKNYSTVPFTIYGKVFTDAGSVYSKKTSLLANKFLWTGGLGLDIVTLYDISLSIHFSFNNLNEKGFFFHASR